MKKIKFSNSLFLNACFFISFFIILFSSIINIYEKRNEVLGFIKAKYKPGKYYIKEQKDLAFELLNGGYILFFRHAEREKWIDVKKYDSIETNEGLKAENEYFKNAVCLSERGLIQAKAMGEIIKKIKLPYHTVVSSPSCRARQTAELVFDGYDYTRNIFVHYGPYDETPQNFIENVKAEILKIETKTNSNIIISAHNGVIRSKNIFDGFEKNIDFSEIAKVFMEEGGFIVMKKVNNKLIFIDLFHTFHDFQKNFRKRPLN